VDLDNFENGVEDRASVALWQTRRERDGIHPKSAAILRGESAVAATH
jgi:hypothetical protein